MAKAKASYSVEAQEASKSSRYARALRRVVKRRRAIAQAYPFAAAIIGLSDSYKFCSGNLCYIVEERPKRHLRILDLRQTSDYEIVVDIPALIGIAVPRAAKCRRYVFKVLYHADGVTSCLLSFARRGTENWLLIFQALDNRILGTFQLDSISCLFVRNNKDYLYFGTHSEYGADGHKKWVVRGFNLRLRQLFERKVHLCNVVGYDIGSTVSFEIFGDFFYGVSNSTDFEIEEIDWTSYYYCFRFPLADPSLEKTQVMGKQDSWRRQHLEGPIDDRWSFLNLEEDEATGGVRIIESRKEWLTGQSGNRRTYYIKEACFRDEGSDWTQNESTDELPDDPLTGLLASNSKPNYMLPQRRCCHPGDDGSLTLARSKTHLCSYYYSCNTYLDLVDDTEPTSPDTPRLRLRTGTRMANTSPTCESVRPEPCEQVQQTHKLDNGPTQCNRITFWPPTSAAPKPKPTFDMVQRIMNPPEYQGNVVASNDDRSIIYAIGGQDGDLKALVYLSFDPAMRLAGMARGGDLLGETATPNTNLAEGTRCTAFTLQGGAEAACVVTPNDAVQGGVNQEAHAATLSSSSSSSTSQTPGSSSTENAPNYTLNRPREGKSWARIEGAFHQIIPGKITFAKATFAL